MSYPTMVYKYLKLDNIITFIDHHHIFSTEIPRKKLLVWGQLSGGLNPSISLKIEDCIVFSYNIHTIYNILLYYYHICITYYHIVFYINRYLCKRGATLSSDYSGAENRQNDEPAAASHNLRSQKISRPR